MKKIGSLEITRYNYELIDGEPKIVISMVKVLDQQGEYIKFAKLKEVEPYLSLYTVNFKNKKND
jgi:hypothetical protein|tara:strand:+ start:1030 stop:1221 length:192 start_codon:yes stop_codon:yes gene_type:complete